MYEEGKKRCGRNERRVAVLSSNRARDSIVLHRKSGKRSVVRGKLEKGCKSEKRELTSVPASTTGSAGASSAAATGTGSGSFSAAASYTEEISPMRRPKREKGKEAAYSGCFLRHGWTGDHLSHSLVLDRIALSLQRRRVGRDRREKVQRKVGKGREGTRGTHEEGLPQQI